MIQHASVLILNEGKGPFTSWNII